MVVPYIKGVQENNVAACVKHFALNSDDESSVDRPVKELKGFEKVFLSPGESKLVKFIVKAEDLSYFEQDEHKWVAEPGTFTAHLASASDDIRTSVSFDLK